MLNFSFETDPFEIKELATAVRKFASKEILESDFNREHFNKMGSLGISAMSIPATLGGIELSSLGIATVIFELSRACMGPAIYLSVHNMVSKLISSNANNPYLEGIVKKLASAENLGAFCLTEASAGSDASSIKTFANKTAQGWSISGEKIYITSAGHADIYLVFAKTNENEISAFVVEKNAKGLSFGPEEKKMGAKGSPIASLHFDNVYLQEHALLGTLGQGYKIALSGLNGGRVNIASAACGIAAKAIEIASQHCNQRKQFGQNISQFQGVQFMLADMATKLRASILLCRDASNAIDANPKANWNASMAKCFATDSAMQITTDAVQLLGGAGYLEDYKVEKLMRDAKMLQIVEGTNQIQRLVIARTLIA